MTHRSWQLCMQFWGLVYGKNTPKMTFWTFLDIFEFPDFWEHLFRAPTGKKSIFLVYREDMNIDVQSGFLNS